MTTPNGSPPTEDIQVNPQAIIDALQLEIGALVGKLHTLNAVNNALRAALANARARESTAPVE